MAGADPRICPPAEVLGAFIEGRVDKQTRTLVAHHVARCPECIFIVGEASAYLNADEDSADEDAEGSRTRWVWRAAFAAAVAVLCLMVAWLAASMRDPLDDLRRAAAHAPARHIEGRLNTFSYAPYRSPRSDAAPADAILKLEAMRVARLTPTDARSWHARGVAGLMLNEDGAVAMLAHAVELAPLRADYWSDLAAAHLAASGKGGGAELRAAVAAADRAASLNAFLPAAHFNRALALEELGFYRAAAIEYDRYLALDPTSRWGDEVRARRARLHPS